MALAANLTYSAGRNGVVHQVHGKRRFGRELAGSRARAGRSLSARFRQMTSPARTPRRRASPLSFEDRFALIDEGAQPLGEIGLGSAECKGLGLALQLALQAAR